jgi:cytochrome P450
MIKILESLVKGACAVVAVTVACLAAYILYQLKYFFFPRPGQYPEKYPFQNTYLVVINIPRLLDALWEYSIEIEALTKKKTYIVNTLGIPHLVLTTDVENVTYILKTNFENYGKGGSEFKPKFQGLMGNGIFNADGHTWYAHRKTSALIFKMNRFKTSVSKVFNEDMDEVIIWIRRQGGKPFDLHHLMHRYTLESIARLAFGIRFNVIHKERVQFADDFDYCTWSINKSMVDPMWWFKRYFTYEGLHYHLALNRINKFAYNLIKERRAALENAPAEEKGMNDLLSLYIDKGTFEEDDDSADTYLAPTDETLRDVMLNMVIAGRDTTAQALSWSFFRLCTEAGVQQKLRAEIVSVLRQSGEMEVLVGQKGEGHISYDTLAQMKYVEAFCMEVLRLHPSVPKEGKCCFKDDVLPDGTPVRKGDCISFLPWVMGRDKDLWGEDALEFKPERFLDKARPSPFVFIAFQAGPRTCLGQNFAIQEMKTCLARSLLVFEFALAQDPSTVTYENSLTLPIKGGLKVTAQEII